MLLSPNPKEVLLPEIVEGRLYPTILSVIAAFYNLNLLDLGKLNYYLAVEVFAPS
jgi:hypothetical protein